jgi:hypothetical protein
MCSLVVDDGLGMIKEWSFGRSDFVSMKKVMTGKRGGWFGGMILVRPGSSILGSDPDSLLGRP